MVRGAPVCGVCNCTCVERSSPCAAHRPQHAQIQTAPQPKSEERPTIHPQGPTNLVRKLGVS
eukprot:6884888-Alexandrium_andersonii.AAC.1